MDASAPGGWKTLASENIFSSPWVSLARETVATPSRPSGVAWLVARRPVAAVVAPRTATGDFLLIRQERVPVRRDIWEFPAGQVDGQVDPLAIAETAARELGEEAAVTCTKPLVPLGLFYTSAGFTDECCHLFFADGVEPAEHLRSHDPNEAIHEVKSFSPEALRRAVASGNICDANTLACFARLAAKGII